MTLDELRNLIAQLQTDAAQATDEQLSAALDAIRAGVEEQRQATPTAEVIAALTELRDAKAAVTAEQTARTTAAAQVAAEAEKILGELADPDPAEQTTDEQAPGDGGTDGEGSGPVDQPAAAPAPTDGARIPELVASIGHLVAAMNAGNAQPPAATPQGRPAGRLGAHAGATVTAPRDVVRSTVYVGQDAAGSPIKTTFDLAKAVHDKFRTAYQDSAYSGRMPVAHVGFDYPEPRKLGQDVAENYQKMEAAGTAQTQALVAAGGLCAPLDTLYDVEVIGSAMRPVRDVAMARFQVERGGITYRPPTSAAAAVHGAGQWTLDDDAAVDGREKACYVVDCPNLASEVIWAAYLCLEFSNITTRFDPETTASNVAQGSIAHARLADNLLLSKIGAGSKLLTAARVIGAVRDVLANVDKASAYYRSRHRIDSALPLMWVAPFWVKFLMRADLARQMAAGDWKEALAPTDALINSWFAARDVTPVWHMDGIAGTDEVQTVTITGTPTGGTFTLTYDGQTTAAIAYNATAAQVRAALAALSNLHAEDITVTGGPGPGTAWVVTFGGGEVQGQNVTQMTSTGSFTGGTSPAVAVATTTGGDGAITVNGVTIPSQTYDNAVAGAAIPGFPDKIDSLMFTPGSWLFLDGGTLDLGLVRDAGLNARNRYRQFMETFEGAAFRGVESLRLVMPVAPTGQTAGTKDLDAIAD